MYILKHLLSMRLAKFPGLFLVLFLNIYGSAQAVPEKIVSILNDRYKGWELIENKCGEKRSVFTADINQDGKDDYAVQFLATDAKNKRIIHQSAFYSSKSEFVEHQLFEENYEGIGLKLAFELLPAGTDLRLDPPYDLKPGGARVYVCDSDEFYLWRIENGRIGGGYNRYYVIN